MLLSYLLSWLLFLSSYFTFIDFPTEKVFFNFFKKSPSIERAPSSATTEKTSEQTSFSNPEEKKLWKNVSLFKSGTLNLYQWEKNQNILISIRKDKGLSIKKISDLQAFFKQMEERKTITFSKTSIKNRNISESQIENTDNTALIYTNGTYLDFQNQTVVFEDLSFYHHKMTLHILIHNTQASTREELQAIYSFLENTILIETSLALNEQKEFLSLIKQIKNENK